MADLNQFFQSDAVQGVPPEKLAQLRALSENLKGKNTNEMIIAVSEFSKKQKESGGLTPQEQNIVIEAMKSALTPEQKAKFELMAKFIKSK